MRERTIKKDRAREYSLSPLAAFGDGLQVHAVWTAAWLYPDRETIDEDATSDRPARREK